jgi:single-strand DNA-binding protein
MFQSVTIVGHLGKDPEVRQMPRPALSGVEGGTPVCNFSVAANRRWTDGDGEPQQETTWFRVSAFGRLAEACAEHLARGRLVLVEGRLRPDGDGNPRTWIGDDEQPRASFDVAAQTVRFLDRRGRAGAGDEEEGPGV